MQTQSFISVLLFLSSPAFSASREEIKSAVEQLISERHPTDTKANWTALGEETPDVIIGILDSGVDAYQRIRLLEALGHFEGEKVSAFLKKEMSTASNAQYKISSIKGIVKSEGEKSIESVKGFLQDADADIRVATATAIKRLGTQRAEQVVNDYLATEQTPWAKLKVLALPHAPPPVKELAKSGTNEGKPDLMLVGEWEGYTLAFDSKKKTIVPKKASLVFDLGKEDKLTFRVRLEDEKEYKPAMIEKDKWKWSWVKLTKDEESKVLELYSERLEQRFWLSKK